MITGITEASDLAETLERASLFAGANENQLSEVWLSTRGVLSVPEENFQHAGEERSVALRAACALYPGSAWRTVAFMGPEEMWDPYSLSDPSAALEWHRKSDGTEGTLGGTYGGQSFLLFSMTEPAAIFYSIYDFKLVTGSEEFVCAYFNNDLEGALAAFRQSWAEEVQDLVDEGQPEAAESVRNQYEIVSSQVRLPNGGGLSAAMKLL